MMLHEDLAPLAREALDPVNPEKEDALQVLTDALLERGVLPTDLGTLFFSLPPDLRPPGPKMGQVAGLLRLAAYAWARDRYGDGSFMLSLHWADPMRDGWTSGGWPMPRPQSTCEVDYGGYARVRLDPARWTVEDVDGEHVLSNADAIPFPPCVPGGGERNDVRHFAVGRYGLILLSGPISAEIHVHSDLSIRFDAGHLHMPAVVFGRQNAEPAPRTEVRGPARDDAIVDVAILRLPESTERR